jgi:large subunit ribosomal protein L24
MPKMKIRKGDKVQVMSGKDRGKQASVVRAIPAEGRVIVEGVHVAKRHAKPTRATMQGGVIDKFMPVSVSSVAIVCGSCGPTRIGMRIDEHGRKLRVCKKCGDDL